MTSTSYSNKKYYDNPSCYSTCNLNYLAFFISHAHTHTHTHCFCGMVLSLFYSITMLYITLHVYVITHTHTHTLFFPTPPSLPLSLPHSLSLCGLPYYSIFPHPSLPLSLPPSLPLSVWSPLLTCLSHYY